LIEGEAALLASRQQKAKEKEMKEKARLEREKEREREKKDREKEKAKDTAGDLKSADSKAAGASSENDQTAAFEVETGAVNEGTLPT
jgi:hypothetical protein